MRRRFRINPTKNATMRSLSLSQLGLLESEDHQGGYEDARHLHRYAGEPPKTRPEHLLVFYYAEFEAISIIISAMLETLYLIEMVLPALGEDEIAKLYNSSVRISTEEKNICRVFRHRMLSERE